MTSASAILADWISAPHDYRICKQVQESACDRKWLMEIFMGIPLLYGAMSDRMDRQRTCQDFPNLRVSF